MQSDRSPVFISYDQAERMINALLPRLHPWQPDAVVAIARGGLVPGTMAACGLALKLHIMGWDRASGVVHWIGPAPEVGRVLLVDDCCATGATMAALRQAVRNQGHDCKTLTIAHDPDTTRFVPDFSHPMRDYFRFPWERGEATPDARALRAAGAPAIRETEQPYIGLDLDGVFLPDVATTHYDTDLALALRLRHALTPHPVLPPFARDRAAIITGRPDSDRDTTLEWLARHGFAGIPLHCRPAEVPYTLDAVSRYKAAAATRLGCTHFVESEPEQAIRIAAAAPHLIVSWWSAEECRAWLVGAAGSPPIRP